MTPSTTSILLYPCPVPQASLALLAPRCSAMPPLASNLKSRWSELHRQSSSTTSRPRRYWQKFSGAMPWY